MELLDLITVEHPSEHRAIGIYQGDLTALEPEEYVDFLVVSAFPDDYSPTRGSLIGALCDKGVDVGLLSQDKEADLRATFSCWLSREVAAASTGIQFRRLLCFEPWYRGAPAEVVGDIFRSLAPFVGSCSRSATVAMPIVAAGDQGEPPEKMLEPLVDAAVHWMSVGMPLKWLKIVVRSADSADRIAETFQRLKARYNSSPTVEEPGFAYDAFISYAHRDGRAVMDFVEQLRARRPQFKLFVDRLTLDPGIAWQSTLFEAIDTCRQMIAFLSPAYLESKMCKEEFNMGLFRRRETPEFILLPVYLYSTELPTYMKMVQFVDCREGDGRKLGTVIHDLAS